MVWYLSSKNLPVKVKIRIDPNNEYDADAAGPDWWMIFWKEVRESKKSDRDFFLFEIKFLIKYKVFIIVKITFIL